MLGEHVTADGIDYEVIFDGERWADGRTGLVVFKLKPGEYARTEQGVWYAHVPHATGHEERQQWAWLPRTRRHDDGSITVSPSILVTSGAR